MYYVPGIIYNLYYCCTYYWFDIAYTASWYGINKHFRDGMMVVVFPWAGPGRYHFRWRVGTGRYYAFPVAGT